VPEGDSVYQTAQQLHDALAGKAVTRFELRVPRLALANLTGETVTEVRPRGKHLLMRFSDGRTLHSHLLLDGAWRICSAITGPRGGPAHQIRALVGNSESLAAGYRIHELAIVKTAQEATLVGHLGPDLLDPDWDRDEALTRFAADGDRPIGEALLDQRLVAGVGNVYKVELLFLHRLSPWQSTASVPDLGAVLDDGARLLNANRETPLRSTTGSSRSGEQYWVYARRGRPCRRCRTPIRQDQQCDRVMYFCPACQSGPLTR
jgi:endonuclease-8